jgi:hypothetical protein
MGIIDINYVIRMRTNGALVHWCPLRSVLSMGIISSFLDLSMAVRHMFLRKRECIEDRQAFVGRNTVFYDAMPVEWLLLVGRMRTRMWL